MLKLKKAKAAAPQAGARPAALDGDDRRVRELITPEGVDLRLRIGDAAERAGAFLIDWGIIIGVLVVVTLLAGAAAAAAKGEWFAEAAGAIWLLVFFLLRNLYFSAFELGARGATPGKRAMGLRVAARDGGRLTANAVFARNAMRELEVFLPLTFLLVRPEAVDAWIAVLGLVWSGVFLFFPLFNRDRLRIGDFVAGTWVVKAPRRKLSIDLAVTAEVRMVDFSFTNAQLDAYGVRELHVLENVLRGADRRTMAAVAQRIRKKIDWVAAPAEHDGDFLNAYYAGLRGRLESRLLFGHRRKDKHDRP